jgi:hypothetical protein
MPLSSARSLDGGWYGERSLRTPHGMGAVLEPLDHSQRGAIVTMVETLR